MFKIITAAHAFIPGELNLAHVASTYLPADIYYRLSRVFGINSRFITGLDVHGKYVQRILKDRSVDVEQLKQYYFDYFLNGLSKFNIIPTEFFRTDDTRLKLIMKEGFQNLFDKTVIYKKPSFNIFCENCNTYLSKSEIKVDLFENSGLETSLKSWANESLPSGDRLYCGICSENPLSISFSEQWFLKLNRDEHLKTLHDNQPFKITRSCLKGIYNNDFSEWEFTRDNYYGNEMPLDTAKSLYLWCDSFFSKFIGLSNDFEETCKILNQSTLITFFGKNVLQYYGLVLPTLLRKGFNISSPNIQFSTRGFCFLEKSKELLTLDNAFAAGSADELRFFCAYQTPDDITDFYLGKERFVRTINDILVRTFGRYLSLAANKIQSFPKIYLTNSSYFNPSIRSKLFELYDKGYVRKLLLELEQFVKKELRFLDVLSPNPCDNLDRLLQGYILTYNILTAYIPSLIKDFCLFEVNDKGIITEKSLRRNFPLGNHWLRLLKK